MNEQEVTANIKTPEVLQAFERARLAKLPREVRERYIAEDLEYDRYSDHTNKLLNEARKEGKKETARNLLDLDVHMEKIIKATGLTKEEIEALKASSN